MMPVTEVLEMAARYECNVAVDGLMLDLSAPKEPPQELLQKLRECKFDIIQHLRRVPAEWVAGASAIERMGPPADWPRPHWQQTTSGLVHFVDTWVSQAAALGWTTSELFGCHPANPYARIDSLGLALCCAREDVYALTNDTARLGQSTFYREHQKPHQSQVLVWQLRAAR